MTADSGKWNTRHQDNMIDLAGLDAALPAQLDLAEPRLAGARRLVDEQVGL
ncbi:hypothetical protein [Nonomuraea sp. SYSU D8015]|uniref:hypothetical protein n=1 Tax=Nonomuraea sp. SYSU D8015 TaxID=2593644 RepID=UPI001660C409|nr:hypothetical protein [Nonomuraea sp. SYSU D8015]